MSDFSEGDLGRMQRIDVLCQRFEDDWKSGRRPVIEDYLESLPEEDRSAALVELLLVEWSYRSKTGESISLESDAQRFAALSAAVQEAAKRYSGYQTFERTDELGSTGSVLPTFPNEPTQPPAGSRRTGPEAVGCYEILQELGRGGMGVVYKARHEQLRRIVALKVVRAGAHASAADRERFRREGEALARLEHPNVVRIHHFDEHEGQPYIVMELVEGGSLAARLEGGPQPERETAELVEAIARAVHVAHGLGIVHRDLKPSNVLLAEEKNLPPGRQDAKKDSKEVQAAEGREEDPSSLGVLPLCLGVLAGDSSSLTPKITDFGLAKLLDSDSQATDSGAVLGTPSYMAPEMAHGDQGAVGPATDVYALGGILYACLTGQPPFKGKTSAETLEQVRHRRPRPPSELRPGLSPELELVCLTCLEHDPARRYASAEALADDLAAWLAGRPTSVQPPGRVRRAIKALRRRPRLIAAVFLAVLVALAGWAANLWTDPNRAIDRIEAGLAQGKPQTLIGATGKPAWSVSAVGGKPPSLALLQDGALQVSTFSLALVELMRDPQVANYRLRGEVRHDETRSAGEVGLFVGHRKHETHAGMAHSFMNLSFNDAANAEIQNVWLQSHFYLERDQFLGRERIVGGPARQLNPAGFGRGTFRRIAIEVRPRAVRAFWEDTLIGEWVLEHFAGDNRRAQKRGRKRFPDDPLTQLPPEFAPRGGLGLFVKVGSASFRRVVLEPLAEPE
jgi:serine/threonine protein kinase